ARLGIVNEILSRLVSVTDGANRLAVDGHVKEDRRLMRVIIPDIVAELGVAPDELTGHRVERHRGIGPLVTPWPVLVVKVGAGVPGSDIDEAQGRVDHGGHPYIAAAMIACG